MTPEDIRAKTEALKDQLRACQTVAEVNEVARRIGPAEVKAHEAADPIGVIHIRNLAAYKRAEG